MNCNDSLPMVTSINIESYPFFRLLVSTMRWKRRRVGGLQSLAAQNRESRIARFPESRAWNRQKFRSEKRKNDSNRKKVELQKIDSESPFESHPIKAYSDFGIARFWIARFPIQNRRFSATKLQSILLGGKGLGVGDDCAQLATWPQEEGWKQLPRFYSGPEKELITKGVFLLEESLESLKSLKSLESLENGRILLCFPQSGGSLRSLESLNLIL